MPIIIGVLLMPKKARLTAAIQDYTKAIDLNPEDASLL